MVKDCFVGIASDNKKMATLTLHVLGAVGEHNSISAQFWGNANITKIHGSIDSYPEEWKLLWFTLIGKVQSYEMNIPDFSKMVAISSNKKLSLLSVKEYIPSPKDNFKIGGTNQELQKQESIENKMIVRQVTMIRAPTSHGEGVLEFLRGLQGNVKALINDPSLTNTADISSVGEIMAKCLCIEPNI